MWWDINNNTALTLASTKMLFSPRLKTCFSFLGKKACRYPGDPKNGRITPVKFLYEVGDRILIQCEAGHINTGKQKLQCMSSGSWSDRMPTCLSYRN